MKENNRMDELRDYVTAHAVRGDCTCGRCIDGKEHPEQPNGHTADMAFFRVAVKDSPDAEKLRELVTGSVKGDFCDIDMFDGPSTTTWSWAAGLATKVLL